MLILNGNVLSRSVLTGVCNIRLVIRSGILLHAVDEMSKDWNGNQ